MRSPITASPQPVVFRSSANMQLPPISFEFFPPKTGEGRVKLAAARAELLTAQPEYFSVTFGAGGSTREGTLQTVAEIHNEGHTVAPHISCVGATRDSIRALLDEYRALGIKKVVALRGDLPSGYGGGGEFRHAIELVECIRTHYDAQFEIWVAAYPEYHPQSRSAQQDMAHFVAKMKAGATGAITQLFFNSDAYFHFCDEVQARGVTQPIVAGLMPIDSFSSVARFCDRDGAEIPRWMRRKFEGFGDDAASVRAFATEIMQDLVAQVAGVGCPGIHFYTLNRAEPTLAVLRSFLKS
jgi:methylenetetrahydrofolate reductase (NADPH)